MAVSSRAGGRWKRALALPLWLLACGVLVGACGHDIGDSCGANVDCDPYGTRFCDTSAPGGYCTIDGCDVDTCPDNSACIRFFTVLMNQTCTHDANGTLTASDQTGCDPDERCLCDQTDEAGLCEGGAAHCAPETTERRWCQKTCGDDTDCRDGYECRETGTLGAEPVPTAERPTGKPVKFCAPKG